jgi:carbon starvation protein
MFLPFLAIAFLVLITVAYRFYGGWVARQFQLSDATSTPAHRLRDGVDYVPTPPFYLFAQHFSAIAAAGPIAGPILAAQSFGWLPALLWIGLGVVLIGAVHDFASLTASVRHEAGSIAEIARQKLGRGAGTSMMLFILIALVYIIVAFADITAAGFVAAPEELAGRSVAFDPGGAVAAASLFFLLISLVMGLVQKFFSPPLWLLTLVFVPATLGGVWCGTLASTWFSFDAKTWGLLIMAYCGLASMAPVWLLLQPRGYLGGFVLYGALALGVFGIFFGGYEIAMPAFKGWDAGGATGTLMPFLFVTIACGACSGFHGLVCSGTTSKQVDRESHMHSIGYGAMLAEGFVAFIALAIVMIAGSEKIAGLKPGTIYGNGIGEFLTLIIGKEHLPFAITFGAMAFATFVFDTLDVSARLGRYLLQELTGLRNRTGAVLATLFMTALPGFILWTGDEGGWLRFWTLFGASNQLLAALTLLIITLWLYKARRRIAFTLIPMLFVLVITFWALVKLALGNFAASGGLDANLANGVAACLLMLLAIFIVIQGLRRAREERDIA